ncbi:hypothetical protein [Iamia sp.]|uniref:hypothetical protein n=1 Tax=Iamia sp. TaxID=2722710 RepID=UPI002C8569B8|nr:hypothetical protein [Iamia sp.]HXH57229.1 hypothetical protein [Iamia sp.]
MARRIDIELTSARDDGSWTWRAAGAREPKGVVPATVLPGSSSVGDTLRVEVEIGLDGTEITAVLPARKVERVEPARIELNARELTDDELVTSKLAGRRGGRARDGGGDRDGGGRRGGGRGGPGGAGGPGGGRGGSGPGGPGGPGRGSRDGRPGGETRSRPGEARGSHDDARRDESSRGRPGGGDRARRRPPTDDRPKPKRLRPQRTHRRAVLDSLEVHERPIADEVLKGGIPAVRQAVEKQNAQARAEGRPEVDPAQLEALAERLLPRLRTAEWRDRADAALADIDELDLRDLRTVVVAADSGAKDAETRALATQLRAGLDRRIEADQAAWLAELAQLLGDGRVVRALRVSSRPPKAGSPLPTDLATRLTDGANASLTAETPTDRWATVLDALSLSPVHARVVPQSIPAEPSDELKAAVAAAGSRVPLVAQAMGVEPASGKARRPPRRGPGRGGPGSGGSDSRPVPPPPPADPQAATPTAETPSPPAAGDAPVSAASPEVAVTSAAAETTTPSSDAPEAPPAPSGETDTPITAAAPEVAVTSATAETTTPSSNAPEAPAGEEETLVTAASAEVAQTSAAAETTTPSSDAPEAPPAPAGEADAPITAASAEVALTSEGLSAEATDAEDATDAEEAPDDRSAAPEP